MEDLITISVELDTEEAVKKLKLLEEYIDRLNKKIQDINIAVEPKINGEELIKIIDRGNAKRSRYADK